MTRQDLCAHSRALDAEHDRLDRAISHLRTVLDAPHVLRAHDDDDHTALDVALTLMERWQQENEREAIATEARIDAAPRVERRAA